MPANPHLTSQRPQTNLFSLLLAHVLIWGSVAAGLYRMFFFSEPGRPTFWQSLAPPLLLAFLFVMGIRLYLKTTRPRDRFDALHKVKKEEREMVIAHLFKIPLVISYHYTYYVIELHGFLSERGELVKMHPTFADIASREQLTAGSRIKGLFVQDKGCLELLDQLVVLERPAVERPVYESVRTSVRDKASGTGPVIEKYVAEAVPRMIKRGGAISYWYENQEVPVLPSLAFQEDFYRLKELKITPEGGEAVLATTGRARPLTWVLRIQEDFVVVDAPTFYACQPGDWLHYEMNYHQGVGRVTRPEA